MIQNIIIESIDKIIKYIYTYKTTLRVIRRFGGGGKVTQTLSADLQELSTSNSLHNWIEIIYWKIHLSTAVFMSESGHHFYSLEHCLQYSQEDSQECSQQPSQEYSASRNKRPPLDPRGGDGQALSEGVGRGWGFHAYMHEICMKIHKIHHKYA